MPLSPTLALVLADALAELALYADTDEAAAGRELVATLDLDEIEAPAVQYPQPLFS